MGRSKHRKAYMSARPLVLERDNNKCVKCASKVALEVHHVNGYTDNDIKNLQTLCCHCHLVAPMGEDYWTWLDKGMDGVKHIVAKVGQKYAEKYEGLIASVMLSVEETRLELRVSRQKEGIALAKKRDVYAKHGRKKGANTHNHNRIIELKEQGYTRKEIASTLGCNRQTVWRVLKSEATLE